jgi:DNA-binding SARP family transcriptional activator
MTPKHIARLDTDGRTTKADLRRQDPTARSYGLGDDVQFRILGPLTVERAGQDLEVRSAKLRAVLAYLLTHSRRLVTADALIDELWGGNPPPSATNTLQTYISQLRHLLEPDRPAGTEPCVLRTVPGGYMLAVEPHTLDHIRFEDALRDGRAALEADEPEKAAERLRDGLALWRGPALANVGGSAAELESARLDELRLVAFELRIEADLACGRHDGVVAELEQLVREHPWRERFVGQLMLALYRCGRQAEALARYRGARDGLVAELGINPGAALQALERRMLQQDPGLELSRPDQSAAPGAATEPPGDSPTTGTAAAGRRQSGRGAVLAGCAVAVLIVLVGLIGGLWPRRDAGPAASGAAPASEVYNEFDLAVHPGIGYDLDVPPGRPADWHATNNPRSPDYDFLDFYRTSSGAPDAENQISGVDLRNTNQFNAIHKIADTDPPAVCHRLPQQGGGNVKLRDLHAGAKVCLRTHADRWAMITVSRMPADRAELLLLHVTVLTS